MDLDSANESANQNPDNTSAGSLANWINDQLGSPDKGLPKSIKRAIEASQDERTTKQQSLLRDYFIEHVYAPARDTFAPLHKRLNPLEAKLTKLNEQIPATLVYRELERPRPAFVLHRGEYDQRHDEVPRAVPTILPQLPEGVRPDRLALAQWLVSREHPLTARVTVNRLWQQVFGRGIVTTSEDFGSQGEPPSHPALLDWLAIEFQDNGWDVKALLKHLVMSATYRQSSKTTPQLRLRDPGNRLLARGSRHRLDAEMLRDQALFVSGLLVNKLGGPSVKPPQPAGLWLAVGYSGSNTVRFQADEAADKIYRRAVYTFIKRTAPPPQLSTFDAPSREYCTVRRERTNTPLQALLLLNEPQFLDAARALARRMMRERDSTIADRIAYMFELSTARPPHPEEVRELVGLYEDNLKTFSREPEAARQLIGEETAPLAAAADPACHSSECAAWTMVANLVLNLDEVVNKN